MAVLAYPYETQDTTETQYQRILRETQDDGVVDSYGGAALRPTIPGGNMRVNVANGFLWARGVVMEVTGGAEFATVDPAGTSARTDLLVARLDAVNNVGSLVVKPGPGGATLPALTLTDNVWEVPLASIAVGAGVTTLTSANLTDLRQYTGSRTGNWSTATRPGTRGTPAPRRGQMGYNETTGLWEFWTGSAWANLGTKVRLADITLPTTRLANQAAAPPLNPAYNLLDGSKVWRSDNPPAAGDGQDWDVWLEW